MPISQMLLLIASRMVIQNMEFSRCDPNRFRVQRLTRSDITTTQTATVNLIRRANMFINHSITPQTRSSRTAREQLRGRQQLRGGRSASFEKSSTTLSTNKGHRFFKTPEQHKPAVSLSKSSILNIRYPAKTLATDLDLRLMQLPRLRPAHHSPRRAATDAGRE